MPSCAPELNLAEGIWPLLKHSIADFAATDLNALVRVVKRRLRRTSTNPT
jgi:hypothetical protein